ncbi:MAG: hypothetical protein GX452_13810 [Ignavibacteriales bacterium]|nr:hypothetical protein [Ignavibacteriales bacterium]
MNKERLVKVYIEALRIEREVGIPALFTTAQAVIESTWDITPIVVDGKNSNNIFGIKGEYNGNYVLAPTKEWDSKTKRYISINAKFKAYPSLEECIRDHTKLLLSTIKGNQKYSYLDCLIQYRRDRNFENYAKKVLSIYATSPTYFETMMGVIPLIKERTRGIWEVELEEAKTWAVTEGILKPDDSLDYWDRPLTRKELVVILKRIKSIGGA